MGRSGAVGRRRRAVATVLLLGLLLLLGFAAPRAGSVDGGAGTSSVLTTWDCTGSPCPWGENVTGQVAVWPASARPTRSRYGYSLSADAYAPAPQVAGWAVTVTSGSATVYAISPTGSHLSLATLDAGQRMTLPTALGPDQVVSLQSGTRFGYTLAPGVPSSTEAALSTPSVLASWDCTGAPCPWGEQTTGHVAAWPAAAAPVRSRYGYTLSRDVYARASTVTGWTVTITAGTVTVYAGTPNGSHVALASLQAGQSFTVPAGLGADEVVSVQSASAFDYTLSPGARPAPPPSAAACTDPTRCDPVSWTASRWRYTGRRANPGDWVGGVVAWPSWSARSSNGRTGFDARTVYARSGERLYPYMGAWADGCRIRVVSGSVLVIEWEHGSDDWRETRLSAGESHTIRLTGAEDSAMIETPNSSVPFQVSLSDCTPRRIDKASSR